MPAVLIDTHVWAWGLSSNARLSATADLAMAEADALFISPISIYEIAQKVRIGKWPAMARAVIEAENILARQGVLLTPVSPEIMIHAGLLDWPHRDPFDRMIAATAIVAGMPLISADPVFDAVLDLTRIWE